MSKHFLEDMVKIKNASKGQNSSDNEWAQNTPVKKVRVDPPKQVIKEDANKSRYPLWIVAIISLLFFLFALSYLFSKATVTVNPKIEESVLDENLSASLDGNAETLPFDLVVISGEENKTVQTTEEKDVSLRAEGVVMIYNAFSSSSQALDIDTRLEGSNGKMYKTKKRIVVPGMTKGSVPGSSEVGIYASASGEEYNSAPLDFKIFGFKGTPKYSKFYARSKGPIAGGFQGKFSTIGESEKTKVVNEMKTALQVKLLKKATDQIPDGFILFKDGVFLNTDDKNIDFTISSDKMLPVKLRGTLYGIIFDEQKISKKIAEDKVLNYDGGDIYIPKIRDLTFFLFSKDSDSFGSVKNIEFNLSGPAKIVWKFDQAKLAGELLGKSKKDFNQILSLYPNVLSAELKLSPFWKMSFPKKTEQIEIIVNYPN